MGFIGHAPLICIVGFVYLTVKNTKIVLVIQKNQYSVCCVCCLITFKPAAELLRNLKTSRINFLILTALLIVYSHGTDVNPVSSRRGSRVPSGVAGCWDGAGWCLTRTWS